MKMSDFLSIVVLLSLLPQAAAGLLGLLIKSLIEVVTIGVCTSVCIGMCVCIYAGIY